MTLRTPLVFALVALVFAGCASGPSLRETQEALNPLDQNTGRIYFYREETTPLLDQPKVYLNDEVVGRSIPGGFFVVDRPPGEYRARCSKRGWSSLTFTPEAGETRYVRTVFSRLHRGDLIRPYLVAETEALPAIEQLLNTGS